jgi:flagellar protein FlaJ
MADKDIVDIDQLRTTRRDYARNILIVCIVIAAIIFAFGAIDAYGGLETPLDWIQYVAIGLMVICGPYGFYVSMKNKQIMDIEARLPDFLRDVAEAGRFGMTLAEAVVAASKGRYGKLSPEIKRMAAQIDWGVPAAEAMRLFTERVNTPLVNRMMSIIIKANDAGGNVADVLTMVAHDSRETLLNQEERKITMSTYMVVTYIAFFVFIATIVILNSTFLPQMVEAGSQMADGNELVDIPTTIEVDIIPQVQFLFVAAVVIHAFGDGILAGVLQDGRISNGMRHSFIMLLIGFIGTSFL